MLINLSKENVLYRMNLPGSALQLAIFRVALGMQIFYSSSSQVLNLLQVVTGTTKTKTLLPDVIDGFIASVSVPYLAITVQILSAFLVLGLFTRYVLPILFITSFCLFNFFYCKYDAPVPWLYIWFPLLILCFTRCADKLSFDSAFGWVKQELINTKIYRWPIEIIICWFSYIYVAAGLAKVLPFYKGLGWLDGATSQGIIHDRFLDSALNHIFHKPFFDYTEHAWFFAALSIFSLLIELVCIVLYFTDRFNYLIIFLVMSMHFFLYLTGVPGFMQLALMLSITLIRPNFFNKASKKRI